MTFLPVKKYYVGIVCALPTKRAAVRAILNEEHRTFLDKDAQDYNTYFAGRVYNYNIIIIFLLAGVNGTTAAASVATNIVRTFKGLRLGLIVGIRDSILNLNKGYDIRLGDIVVS
jgi:hypothetical protein